MDKKDYIIGVKVIGKEYLSYIEIETRTGEVYKCGIEDYEASEYEFEIPSGFKVISFAGVLEAQPTECRLLNLNLTIKEVYEDCDTAENSMPFKDFIKNYYKTFNIYKIKSRQQIKRIKEVRLYPGRDLSKRVNALDGFSCDVVGGIDIVYETVDGEEISDGLIDLACKIDNVPPVVLELKENECNYCIIAYSCRYHYDQWIGNRLH